MEYNNSRKCIECGKQHDTIVEDTRTGERIKEIDKCKNCIFKVCFIKISDDPNLMEKIFYKKI